MQDTRTPKHREVRLLASMAGLKVKQRYGFWFLDDGKALGTSTEAADYLAKLLTENEKR